MKLKTSEITCSKEAFLSTFELIKNHQTLTTGAQKTINTYIKYYSKKLDFSLDNFNEIELLKALKISDDLADVWLAKKIEEILELDNNELEHYLKVIDNSTLCLKVWLDWKIISSNNKFAELAWYSIEELIWFETKDLSWNFSLEKPQEFWKDLWETVLSWNIWQWSIKNQTKYWDYYRTETTIVPKVTNWKVEYFTVVRTDITESEKQKLELIENNMQLTTLAEDLMDKISKLEILSMTDSLTWLENRRSFDKKLLEEFNRTKRDGANLALIIFDIDFFKKINDTYWHDIWDHVIKRISEYLKINFRITDFKARIWWEEFAVILPSTSSEEALALREKFRKIVENIKLNQIENITISVGISCYNKNKKEFITVDTLFKKADEALYTAKNSGRNIVKTSI